MKDLLNTYSVDQILLFIVLLTVTNLSSTFKNLNNQNTASTFYLCNKRINNTIVGTDSVALLRAAGWVVPE